MTHEEESDLAYVMSAIVEQFKQGGVEVEDPELNPLREKLWAEMTARCGGHPGRMVRLIDGLESTQEAAD